ncbi:MULTISPECIES: Crp/Fnr family transcriptional regulator [Methylobacterium]|uniref:Crp/Fnr family transcriptional regulator n=1 Tax=Methylobacterium TaxID=407 RepID=UPI0013ECAD07|nr:Crp/Fnr family transcriptional regulator [Methylobacterium sp. DB0501]NGM34996.1 Crp/Fnr family transcriptional regulator [Methylobacterium sp. DB0501]
MPQHLIRKLDHCVGLSGDDQDTLTRLVRDVAWFSADRDMIDEGAAVRQVSVILEGRACGYKQLEDGRRQIVAYLFPGDLCSTPFVFPTIINYSVRSLTSVRVARIEGQDILSAMQRSAGIARAFWLDTLATAAIQREWTANVGLRTARERIAHLLCEIMTRLRAVGLADRDSCTLPLTQEDIGETVGLSTVHVNRILQDLRASGLITLKRQQLTIPDFAALRSAAHFDGSYLCHPRPDLDRKYAPVPQQFATAMASPALS